MPTPSLFSLATYVVRVRNVKERTDEIVSSFDGNDLLAVVQGYLKKVAANSDDNEAEHLVLRVPHLLVEGRRLYGTIETGLYGREGILYHRKKKQDVYKKSRDEADMAPFFFMLEVPKGTNEAILILQRTSAHGIRKILYRLLAPAIQKEFENLRLRIDPMVLKSDLDKLFRGGRVTQIRFCRFGLSSDIADHYEGGHKESPGRMELVYYARRGDHFNLTNEIKKVMAGKSVAQVFALEDIDFDFETVKLAVEQNGRTKRVDMTKYLNIRSYHDVTDQLRILASGHPDLDSIKTAATELLARVRKQLYGAAG